MSIPKRLVLKDTHPTMVKFNKLYDLAEELGISIQYYAYTVIVTDRDRDDNLPPIQLEYVDVNGDETDTAFPPIFDFRLVYDNPDYLAEQKRLLDERVAKQEAERKAAEEKLLADKEAAEQKRLKKIEEAERAELVRLQEKYKDDSKDSIGV